MNEDPREYIEAVTELLENRDTELEKEIPTAVPVSSAQFIVDHLDIHRHLQESLNDYAQWRGRPSEQMEDVEESLTSITVDKFRSALEHKEANESIITVLITAREVAQLGYLAMMLVNNFKRFKKISGETFVDPNDPYYQTFMTIHDNFFRAGGLANPQYVEEFTNLVTDPTFFIQSGPLKL